MKITKIKQGKKQARNSYLKTQPSENSDCVARFSNIMLPTGEAQASQSEGNSFAFKNSRPNLRQLYDFLKHQVIVVKQKQRIITNKQQLTRFKSISQMHEKLTQAICLKSQKEELLKENPNKKIKTICLPKIERNCSQINQNSNRKRKPQLHRFPKKIQINDLPPHKRLSSLGSRLSNLQNSPLLSYKYFQRKRTEQPLIGEVLINPPQIINFQLYKQNPRISNLSLEVAMSVSKENRRFLSQQH